MKIRSTWPTHSRGTTEVTVALNCLYTKGGGARACNWDRSHSSGLDDALGVTNGVGDGVMKIG